MEHTVFEVEKMPHFFITKHFICLIEVLRPSQQLWLHTLTLSFMNIHDRLHPL